MKTWSRILSGVAIAVVLTACGFTMRGVNPLPFDTLYLGVNDNSSFGVGLIRAVRASSPATKLVASPKEAQAIYTQLQSSRSLREVSLNAVGRVEQYELTVTYVFRVTDPKGQLILSDTALSASREVPFDDQFMQAKDDEFQRIYEDLEVGLVARIVRRISSPEVRTNFERVRSGTQSPTGPDPILPTMTPQNDAAPDIWRRESGSPGGIRR
ncbi:MAG: LPS assembly lipoprotein LptE [Burkholderiaceae bacterium]